MPTLAELNAQTDALERNRLLFRWLCDDADRPAFYAELRQWHFPVLRLKSLLPGGRPQAWPDHDLYVVSDAADVATALRHGSVAPYAELPSGGAFMLGIDDPARHAAQRRHAADALRYGADQVEACVAEAWRLGALLPLQQYRIDAALVAEQVALRFVEILFGLPLESHVFLERLMAGIYRRLTFQIVGRHFAGDPGPPLDDPKAIQLREDLDAEILRARDPATAPRRPNGFSDPTVMQRLHAAYHDDPQMLLVVVKGLVAGTIGNVRAAVTLVLQDLFTPRGGQPRQIEAAVDDARRADPQPLRDRIAAAMLRHPPAPFLARTATRDTRLRCGNQHVPEEAHLLLLMGADPTPESLFGGTSTSPPRHDCVGQRLALPLITGIVRGLLRLDGLERRIDPDTGTALEPEKLWGAICTSFPLQYQRESRLNQQPLFVVLPIKEPVEENARKLAALTAGGACIVEDALNGAPHVHFAWFSIIEHGTCLAMSTVYDGDFDSYVKHFAASVRLFDRQFQYLDVDQPLPVSQFPNEFVETIRKYNRAPLAGYFYSAYPLTTVTQVRRGGGQ